MREGGDAKKRTAYANRYLRGEKCGMEKQTICNLKLGNVKFAIENTQILKRDMVINVGRGIF